MPSWGVHIALANKLNKKLKLSDDFIIGNILPDVTNGFMVKNISNIISHSITHYNFEGANKFPKNNISKFLEVYQNKLNNPLILGSLLHIITDNFFNDYTFQRHIKIIGNEKVAILNDGSILKVVPWKLKQEDFGKYSDYLIYNKMLGNLVSITDETLDLVKDLSYDLSKEDMINIIDRMNSFIGKKVSNLAEYKMFTLNELNKVFDDCYNHLESGVNDLISNNKIKIKERKIIC